MHGIIRLTNTDSDTDQLGDALPLLQINKPLKMFKFTSTSVDQAALRKFVTKTVPQNVLKSYQIKMEVSDAGYTLTFTYDGEELVNKKYDNKLKPPLEFTNVSVYVSDNFYPAVPATMQDLVIKTCKLFLNLRSISRDRQNDHRIIEYVTMMHVMFHYSAVPNKRRGSK